MTTKPTIPPWVDNLTKERALGLIGPAQVAIFVMVGGGFIGKSFAEQPKDAYIDARVTRRPYKYWQIAQARLVLVTMAQKAGLDPSELPAMPDFGTMGVF